MSEDAFEPLGALPEGEFLLEASAGTGKTYAVAGLVARYIAEAAVPIEQLMVVTFSRSATSELRHRVRDRLREALRFLDDHPAAPPADPLLEHLRGTDRELRLSRLSAALSSFDRATITTIHALAMDMLTILGTPLAGTLQEDGRHLRQGIGVDVRIQALHRGVKGKQLPYNNNVGDIVDAAITRFSTRLRPEPSLSGGMPALSAWIAKQARDEYVRRTRRERVFGFDDLLRGVEHVLTRDTRAAVYLAHLRDRFRVALVDEFQDTDPVQLRILRELFGAVPGARTEEDPSIAQPRTMVMVGDPKQAIYRFRGGDVHAYVTASRSIGARRTLSYNWRSDDAVVHASNMLFGRVGFGLGIRAETIKPRYGRRAHGFGDVGARLRLLPAAPGAQDGSRVREQRLAVAEDAAEEVVALLSDEQKEVVDPEAKDVTRLRPKHVAVLVRTNREAGMMQQALGARGVPSVLNGVGNVFATDAAHDWLHVLRAVESPSDSRRARLAALTPLLGGEVADLLDVDNPTADRLAGQMNRWAEILRDRGVATMYRQIVAETAMYERLLGQPQGPRLVADFEHLAELLHDAAVHEGLAPAALLTWLERNIADAPDVPTAAHARRLEGTDDAVQIMTVHRAKGLQFPVVLCPFLWTSRSRKWYAVMHYIDPHDDVSTLLFDGRHPDKQHFLQEEEQEELRLAYVAITRAMHQAILWWPWGGEPKSSPLAAILFDVDEPPEPTADVAAALARHPAVEAGRLAVEVAPAEPTRTTWAPPPPDTPELFAHAFTRVIDQTWRRTSYSGLVDGAHHAVDVDGGLLDDDVVPPDDPDDAEGAGGPPVALAAGPNRGVDDEDLGQIVPLSAMPGGADVGTAIHTVMEEADYTAEDLSSHLRAHVDGAAERFLVPLGDHTTVVAGLEAVLHTPLGRDLDDLRLVDVAWTDRRDEIDFELPLAGGERDPGAPVTLAGIADVLADTLPPDDPLVGYPAHLRSSLGEITARGYLGGRIDLLLRTRDQRFVVIDHKTNRLAPPQTPLREGHYSDTAMAATMHDSHYALQALLYTVALHRMLRWRLPGYDPERHLGGARYLFLRGMTGADVMRFGPTAMPGGVFVWRPPAEAILGVDRLLTEGGS